MEKRRKLDDLLPEETRVLLALLAVLGLGYFLLSDLMGGTLFQHQEWDSYTLQAWNWLRGRTYIPDGEKYTWLELAVYGGRYYVSFPPLPSVAILPFVALFGLATPNNAIVGFYGLIAVILAYHIMLAAGRSPRTSAFWALVCVWGSNMMWMTTNGGVWFQAQALNMVMCLAAVLAAMKGKKALSTTFLALAVGCRPWSIVFLPVFAVCFAWDEREEHGGFFKSCLAQWRCLIGPVLIGACYMAYNYVRFHDPLEFGHNYLPEFMEAEHGQFHISYLWPNLKRLLTEPIRFKDGLLDVPLFQGFMFYVANPLFLIWAVHFIRHAVKKDLSLEDILLAAGMGAELLLTCMHRTLGSWQFGARYTCDMLPFAYMFLAKKGPKRIADWELLIGGFAVVFNVYGAMHMFFNT